MKTVFKYAAFISYNSRDNSKARWLQNRLENYCLPSIIANEKKDYLRLHGKKSRKFRIFRYVTDLVAQNLEDGLRKELDQSKYLIVICSPNSANAPWVRKEVKYFIETGRKKQIIPFVIKGNPYSGGASECFTPELKEAFPGGSALGVDLNDYGDDLIIFRKRKAIAKVVSLLIDLPNAYDYIWNRYRSAYIRTLLIRAFLAFLVFLAISFSIEIVRRIEKPFDMSISVNDVDRNPNLPSLEEIELSIAIAGERTRKDTILSLYEMAVFGQIPGRMIGKSMRLMVRNADCYKIDTILPVQQHISVKLHRNMDMYGKIEVVVLKEGELLANQWVEIDNKSYKTNQEGILKVKIPFRQQKNIYSIKHDMYCGIIHMPCIGTKCINLKK